MVPDADVVLITGTTLLNNTLEKLLALCQPKARVVLMTAYGYDASHSIVRARQEGLRCVLYKPFRVDQLLDALENPRRDGQNGKCEP